MTQRIFDIENEKDMADLWNILSEEVVKIEKDKLNTEYCVYVCSSCAIHKTKILKINWHNKTEIIRPIQEATEADTGKLCKFWNSEEYFYIGELYRIKDTDTGKHYEMGAPVAGNLRFTHCRRLTKQEIEELI